MTIALIFNNNQVEPHRLYTLVRLVVHLQPIDRDRLFLAVQPLEQNPSSVVAVLNIAKGLDLVSEIDNGSLSYTSILTHDDVASTRRFRNVLVDKLLNQTHEQDSQYLLNLFAAWYASQNAKVLHETTSQLAARFNTEMFPNRSEQQTFNTTKLNGWMRWASFMGWGTLTPYRQIVLIPDATVRVGAVLSHIDELSASPMQFAHFIEQLAIRCPELDGGMLFNYCQPPDAPKHILSLMLSNALLSLESTGIIHMEKVDDSRQIYNLQTGYKQRPISRIKRLQ